MEVVPFTELVSLSAGRDQVIKGGGTPFISHVTTVSLPIHDSMSLFFVASVGSTVKKEKKN